MYYTIFMKKVHLYFVLWLVIGIISCSKSRNLSPAVALLSSGTWKLQSSDTIRYDSAYHIIGLSTAVVNCSNRLNYVFYSDGEIQFYMGCNQPPLQPLAGWSWSFYGKTSNFLNLTAETDGPRSGPTAVINDSIVTLTKDSLVLYRQVLPSDMYSNIITYYPLLIKSWFTH
jgi:hypothetical protein